MLNNTTSKYLDIQGAKMHNLKDISLKIPKNKLVVITGVSGSGKSSLAFDTLYAEGQRRYVESLSSYARQFLGKLEKPNVDNIKGIAPAIAIEQKVNSRNPRSTVGTTTEIYDYIKLLFARIGKTYHPISKKEVKKHTVEDVIEYINSYSEKTKILVLTKVNHAQYKDIETLIEVLSKENFNRIKINDRIDRLDKIKDVKLSKNDKVFVVVDRLSVQKDNEENTSRLFDSIETAMNEGEGECFIEMEDGTLQLFSNRFELEGMDFIEPHINLFSFNNPLGACPKCEGYGKVIGIDPELVVPNKELSVFEDAVVCWKGEKMSEWKDELIQTANKSKFPIHKPYNELSEKHLKELWNGNKYFSGINAFFKYVESQTYKIQYRVMLSRYRGKTNCPECNGARLRKEVSYIKIDKYSITDLVNISIDKCAEIINELQLDDYQKEIGKRIFTEIKNRLQFLQDVGLGYLTLNRLSNTLSGGESQRINLATSLGSSLVGSLYILDEPSIGLHSKDTEKLIKVLHHLRDIGNSVIVVEHDEDIMKAADYIIDMGPFAGSLGGEIVFEGVYSNLKNSDTLTAQYLTLKKQIPIPSLRRKSNNSLLFEKVRTHNLKGFDARIPLNKLTVITGVSGSGKSTLVKYIIHPALVRHFNLGNPAIGNFKKMSGDLSQISHIEMVDQNPIGKSSRSNPVTYVKAYDEIRALMSSMQLSKVNGYKPKHFSFNAVGGRCDTCDGEGTTTIEMQFMADVKLKCEVCQGKRFKDEILEVKYQEKSIYDILCLTIDQALDFFDDKKNNYCRKIIQKLEPLQSVGLGYLTLGQPSSTLSGGEAQRIKLASFISKGDHHQKTLFIFDEPTTGLHFYDVEKLLIAFNALLDKGHSLLVIEHHPDVIKCADWILDLGPKGGEKGGNLIFEGTPEDLSLVQESVTAPFIKEKLDLLVNG